VSEGQPGEAPGAEDGAGLALVTGAGRGIGAACARALGAEGFRVAVHYRTSEAEARELAEELPRGFAVRADLAKAEEIDALIDELKRETDRIDVLVNNAGYNVNAPLPAMKLDDYDSVAALARGTWYLTKLVLRRFMLRQAGGRIINISSVVGHTGNRGQSPYTMVKAGFDALTKSLTQELAGRPILVNSVAPGFIETEMTAALPEEVRQAIIARIPQGRLGTPEEVAEVVTWLATRAHYVSGTVVHVNGGMYGG
jgi:3-oxoacyl-[acyl-carrier protein] reductase